MDFKPGNSSPPSPARSADSPSSRERSARNTGQTLLPELYTPPMSSTPVIASVPEGYEMYSSQTPYHATPATPMHYSMPEQIYSVNQGTKTRSGRSLSTTPSPLRPSRPAQSPRLKRKTKSRTSGKGSESVLTEPLSIITKDYNVPVRDMYAWVSRPASDRLVEAEQRKGKIARPMNSFMLYRSAYAERAKKFASENNHQVVSKLAGQSWPLEPKEIREMYERYAILERDNHAAAHPQYKFAPNKANKRSRDPDDDEDYSDGDWEGSTRSKRSCSRRYDSRSASSTPFGDEKPPRYVVQQSHYHHKQPAPVAMRLSSYEAGHAPLVLPQQHHGYEYYAPSSGMNAYGEPLEEPFLQCSPGIGGLVSMPHEAHHELLTSYPPPEAVRQVHMSAGGPMQHVSVLDPRLGGNVDMGYSVYYEPSEGQGESMHELPVSYGEVFHPGLATLTTMPGPDEGWGLDEAGGEFDMEFRKMG